MTTKTTDDTFTFTATITVSLENLSDVLITACEGGIGYWFRGLEYHHSVPGGAWMSGYVTDEVADCDNMEDAYGVNECDDHVEDALCEDCVGSVTLLDVQVIADGVQRLLSGQVGIRSDLMAQVMTLLTEDPDVDADAADCIVQAGLFGELVYG